MIDPNEKRPPFFTTLLPTPLYAVLANVDADGNLPSAAGSNPLGTVVFFPDGYVEALAPNLWIVRIGDTLLPSGSVLQIYAPGDFLADHIGGNYNLNPWLIKHGAPKLVVSAFASGITGAERAMAKAMADEAGDIEYMHALDALGNDALAHALYTDLREQVSLEQHLANINELEAFAGASSGRMGDEIREFLTAMRNPRDRLNRYNTERKVLIVRAVQRRAKLIAVEKTDRVEEIVAAQNATARYIADVDTLAGRLISVLTDKQPWWTSTGILPNVNRHRRRNFTSRLLNYAAQLRQISANPFRPWAWLAADRVQIMANKLQTEQYNGISNDSVLARGYLEAMHLQERVSRGIVSVRQKDGAKASFEALTGTIDWALEAAPHLRIPIADVHDLIHEGQRGQRTGSMDRRIDALHAIERGLMAIGVAHAA